MIAKVRTDVGCTYVLSRISKQYLEVPFLDSHIQEAAVSGGKVPIASWYDRIGREIVLMLVSDVPLEGHTGLEEADPSPWSGRRLRSKTW